METYRPNTSEEVQHRGMKNAWRNVFTLTGVLIIMCITYLGTLVITKHNSELDQIKANRILSCTTDNRRIEAIRLAFHKSIEDVIPAGSFPEREKFILQYESSIDESLPYRICTDNGINDWLHNKGGVVTQTTIPLDSGK